MIIDLKIDLMYGFKKVLSSIPLITSHYDFIKNRGDGCTAWGAQRFYPTQTNLTQHQIANDGVGGSRNLKPYPT